MTSRWFQRLKLNLPEEISWCSPRADDPDWPKGLGSVVTESPTMTFDGSIRRIRRSDQLPGFANNYPYVWTIDGIRGRDLK